MSVQFLFCLVRIFLVPRICINYTIVLGAAGATDIRIMWTMPDEVIISFTAIQKGLLEI